MFDQVPVRIWLLIAIAAIAFMPAQYVYRFVVHSPSRRDITQPTPDLSWRTSGQFVRNLSILAALLGLAIFIFTPTAEQFAHSPNFWPILMGAFGAWALFTVPHGFMSGRIEPLIKGFHDTYERRAHPKRFWASMAWNAAMGALFVWLAFVGDVDPTAEAAAAKCNYETDDLLQNKLSACDELIQRRPNDSDAYFYRGLISINVGAFDKAVADLTRAHELSPEDPWPLANRGLAFAWKKDQAHAEEDFRAVRAIDPSNVVMLRGEALLKMNAGDKKGAMESLSASMNDDPDNLWALRTRSELYYELGEFEKSRQDDSRWVQLMKAARATRD